MATRCFTPFKVPRARVTALTSCGAVSTAVCSSVTTDGVISVAQTGNYEDRVEYYVKNGDGTFCVQRTDPPILKWIDVTYTFCNVDPNLVNFMTGGGLVTDDTDTTPITIGNTWKTNDAATVFFAFEGWTRVAELPTNCTNELYGYILFPYNVEGTMSDLTYEAQAVNFVVTARTAVGSAWGVGPYAVVKSAATTTLNNPLPLLTPITTDTHRLMITTFLPPPTSACGCTDATPDLIFADTGVLIGTVTFPVSGITYPVTVNWGDSSTTVVSAGPTSNHTYAMAGTYTVTVVQNTVSGPIWTSAATPVS